LQNWHTQRIIGAHGSVYDAIMKRMAWTDDRLQDRFDSIDRRFDRVDAELRAVNARFDALQRTMLQVGGGVIASLIAGFAGVIVTQL
jgi:hypothetical protein